VWGAVFALALGSISGAQVRAAAPHGPESPLRAALVLEGSVLDAQGAPAEGAVVVSSAGGKAVTDVAGRYRLEVEVPLEATSVQVTAIGGASGRQVASRLTSLGQGGPLQRVDPLRLAFGTPCAPSWVPNFGGFPGTDGEVWAAITYDDGNGPVLVVGGAFTTVAGASTRNVAKWDGASWSALGAGLDTDSLIGDGVRALAVFDDGSGAALYAAGSFTDVGSTPFNRIAKWDGASWSEVGGGFDAEVAALAVHDDGNGAALYAAGDFATAGIAAAQRIARWNGTSWAPLGTGLNGRAMSLATLDLGGGPALFAGGSFSTAGGVAASRVARWNGTSWAGLSSGTNGAVNALAAYDDGSGPALYAGGSFTLAGGQSATRIARWNGTVWSALGSGTSSPVHALHVHDDGGGAVLVVGGQFQTAGGVAAGLVATWNGSTWAAVGDGLVGTVPSKVAALATLDDPSGSMLYAGGQFGTQFAESGPQDLARWDGASWTAPASGALLSYVLTLGVHDDGSGPALYAHGEFVIDGVREYRIARWDGSAWTSIGALTEQVYAMASFDDGSGPALYVGGLFFSVDGVDAAYIAKWNGTSWSALGSGTHGAVQDMVVHDDGSGPALYVGGHFDTSVSGPGNNVARWNGTSWSALGSGTSDFVACLLVFDDGSGPALYAGGYFQSAGGVTANGVARWNGASWSALGSGVGPTLQNKAVLDLAGFDDGSGPVLYATGTFTQAGGHTARAIARWDGVAWSAVSGG
jgi:hypothetical protein